MSPSRHSSVKKTTQAHGKTPALPDVSNILDVREKGRAFVRSHGWLQTTLLLIGVVTVLAVLGALFVAIGDSPDIIYTDSEVAPVDSALFATSLAHLVNAPLERGGSITALQNGDEFLPALIHAIDDAKSNINFSVYIWADGVFAKQVLSALIRARARNVAVRVLLDDFGSLDEPFWKFDDLESAGARIERFRTPQFGKWTRLHRRNHRRAIVIDGSVGFTGGMAVKDAWLGHAQDPDHWRDTMFKVTGPLARSLQAAFASSWVDSCGEILVGPDMYPNAEEFPPGVQRFIHLVNSPAADDYAMGEFFIIPILAARKSLFIVTPYFIPDVHLQSALVKKAKEGVDVRLLVPGKHIDNRMVWLSAQSHYEELLNAGVRIYQYRPSFLHSKFMVVDRQWSVIGSPNLNYRSRQLDEENAFGILDRGFGEHLAQVFLTDLNNSDEINAGEWRSRNVFLRVVQRFARLFEKQS
jgi:cardiolipin synthase